MKTKTLPGLALFITITALLSGCGKPDTHLQSENADLKARVQQLEQQLQAAQNQKTAPSEPAANQNLQGQLAEAQKNANAANDELKTLRSRVESLTQKVDELTHQLADAQQARQNAEKALQLYKDQASSALQQFQALRRRLDGQTPDLSSYHQNYLAAQAAVNRSLAALPQSRVRRQIASLLDQFTHLDNLWETASRQTQARTADARDQYNKFIEFGGLGPNRYVVEMGKDKILAPAEKANAATLSNCSQEIVSSEQGLDQGIQNLQSLLNG